jgi:hypothetical protein
MTLRQGPWLRTSRSAVLIVASMSGLGAGTRKEWLATPASTNTGATCLL